MGLRLKPISRQTIVITGATSGIGLATVQMAARRGANLVLAARSEADLNALQRDIEAAGGQAAICPADVADRSQVRKIADTATARFGSIDTWVNNAGLSIWGRLEQVKDEDFRRMFETNFWGMVNGTLEAARLLKQRGAQDGFGGAIINLGSLASDQAFPLQGMYCASKHAVKGFTDAFRMEMEEEGAPISVTLIKPAGIDTPFPEHAANYMDKAPALPPPIYMPEDVAMAILYAASHPKRDIFVGSASKLMSVTNRMMPRFNDLAMEKTMVAAQQKDGPGGYRAGSLYQAGRGGQVHGGNRGMKHPSVYTRASLHPWITGAVLGAIGVTVAGALGAAATTSGARKITKRVASRLHEYV